MAELPIQLQIIAQPAMLYRERYKSEVDPKHNRAQRFIRTDPQIGNYAYPTIEVSL
jgi:hypothetical protein